jgi:hypothetical protein
MSDPVKAARRWIFAWPVGGDPAKCRRGGRQRSGRDGVSQWRRRNLTSLDDGVAAQDCDPLAAAACRLGVVGSGALSGLGWLVGRFPGLRRILLFLEAALEGLNLHPADSPPPQRS